MTIPGPRPLSDKEAEQYRPWPQEGRYKTMTVDGVRAVLIRQPDARLTRQWRWCLVFDKPPDQPARIQPGAAK